MKKLIYSSLLAVLTLSFCQNNAFAQDQDKVYSFVSIDNPPTYPGGIDNFYKFLGENIKYPADAVKDKVQGYVYVSFTVEKDGSLNDIKVDRALGAGTDEEAIRVLKLSKKWNPGMVSGKNVRVKYNLPIKFALGNKSNSKAITDASEAMNSDIVQIDPKGSTEKPSADDNTVYSFVSMEVPPTYPGGIAEFYNYLSANIIYPTAAKENKIEGNVFVSFTVEKNGSITDVKVDRKLGYGTDEEAVRVLKLSKKWNPGKVSGVPVRVKYNIPIKFHLPN